MANYRKGDVNMDGLINGDDTRLTMDASTDASLLTEEQKTLADIDNDGAVTAYDAYLVAELAAQEEKIYGYKNNGTKVEVVEKSEFDNLDLPVMEDYYTKEETYSSEETNTLLNEKMNVKAPIWHGDMNTLKTPGFYYSSDSTNTPTSANGYVLVQKLEGADYVSQLWISASTTFQALRVCANGVWESWHYAVYSENYQLENDYYTQRLIPKQDDYYTLGSASVCYNAGYFHNLVVWGDTKQRTLITSLYPDSPMTVMITPSEGFRVLKGDAITPAPISAGAFNQISSRRYKENIIEMTEEEAKKIDEINVVKFDYINKKMGTDMAGVIAEDVYEVLPQAVTTFVIDGERVPDSVDYSKFVPYLIKRVQMLEQELTELKNK